MKSMEDSNNEEFARNLRELGERDPDAFVDFCVSYLTEQIDAAVNDNTPSEKKLKAIEKLKSFLIEKEQYEKCVPLRNLEDRIKSNEQK